MTLDTSRLCEARLLFEEEAARQAAGLRDEDERLELVMVMLEEIFCWETSARVYIVPYIRALLFTGCLSIQHRMAVTALRIMVLSMFYSVRH